MSACACVHVCVRASVSAKATLHTLDGQQSVSLASINTPRRGVHSGPSPGRGGRGGAVDGA